uniref:Legume lectin domain-containing protein n=1 Tax=Quercus lobata TaxID=97700 RepID=A0A7N2N070_QUELO
MIQITLCNIPSPTSLQSSNTGCSQLQDKKFQLIMVVYNSKHNHFLPPQLFIPFYIFMIISFFFSQLTKFSSAISFNYTYFSASNPNISYELSAYAEGQVIKLTTDKQAVVGQATVGRATYFIPMHLWDKASGNLTDFTTHFTFIIKSLNEQRYTDGLAFFLAPCDKQLPTVIKGGGLGLAFDDQETTPDANDFVAVEFDIYSNKAWDQLGEHVGIDINSMKSVVTLSWPNRLAIMEGQINEAWICYNPGSHNLSVIFTVYHRKNNKQYIEKRFLSQIIDLRNSLTEWVTFGFSVATEHTTTYTLGSREFSSSWETDDDMITNPEAPNQRKEKIF